MVLDLDIQPGKKWSVIVALLSHVVNNWTEFDGWALSKGFDPLEIPSRRLMAAVWLFITEPLDYEQKDKLIADLFTETVEEVRQREVKKSSEPKTTLVPKERWRAPKGWKPPGWSDEAAYQSAVNFMANKPE